MIPSTVNKPLIIDSLRLLMGLLFFSNCCQAQLSIEWDHTYGGTGYEEMGAALSTHDGGYMFGGITTSRTPAFEISTNTKDTVDFPELTGDFWVVKTDGNGNVLWDKRYGGFRQDRLWSIVATSDGGYLLGGESRSGVGADRSYTNRGALDYWVVKIDENGNKQWDRAYGGTGSDELRKIVPLPNGQFWLTGFSDSPASNEKNDNSINGSADFWIIKIDENGTPMIDFTIGGALRDWLYDAVLSHDGNLILAGWSESLPGFDKSAPNFGSNDYWIVKISQSGSKIWDASFGGNSLETCQRIYKTNDGKYIAIGESGSDKQSGNKTEEHYGGTDLWMVKFEDIGNGVAIDWQKSYGGGAADLGYSVVENSVGEYLVLGLSSSLADSVSTTSPSNKGAELIGNTDFWALYLDANGNKVWDQTLGGTDRDNGWHLLQAHDYGFILAGISSSNIYAPYKSENNRGTNDSNDLFAIRTGCSFPAPELEDIPKACLDDEIILDATIPIPCTGCRYFWNDGGTDPIRSFFPDTTTEFKVTVVHPDGCEITDSATVEIVPGPNAFQADGEPISCYGANDASLFVDAVSGSIAPPYQFSLNGGKWEGLASYTNLNPGNYLLEIRDTNGCLLDSLFNIAQPDSVIVELGPDIYVPFGDSVQLQALTNLLDSFSFEWGQPTLLSCTDCLKPWVRPLFTTTISIELKDKRGCKATDLLRLIVPKSDDVYIPNVFSPNLDNINDFFTVYADKSVKRIKSLQIFDRWGERMFELFDFPPNKEQIGWDGKFEGRLLDPAVFAYWVEAEYIDGSTKIFKGDVTLMMQ